MGKLFDKLPYVYEGSQEVEAIQNSIESEHYMLKNNLNDLYNQIFVDSADWSLDMWENMLGIVNKTDNTLNRREMILGRLKATGVTTVQVIKDVCKSFSGGNVDIVEDFNNYKFTIRFIDEMGIPSYLSGLTETINIIKPAHINFDYEFVFNTNSDLSPYTHLVLSKYTHEELKTVRYLDSTPPPTVNISNITLNHTSYTFDSLNSTLQLAYTIFPTDATDKRVSFSSSTPSIATVNSVGVITSISNGTCDIVCSSVDGSNISASCRVTVNYVGDVDEFPIVNAIEDIRCYTDDNVTITYIAIDDKQIVKHELSENGGTTFKEITPAQNGNAYTVTKTYATSGDRQLKVRVTDSKGQATISNNFTVYVTDKPAGTWTIDTIPNGESSEYWYFANATLSKAVNVTKFERCKKRSGEQFGEWITEIHSGSMSSLGTWVETGYIHKFKITDNEGNVVESNEFTVASTSTY